MQLTRLKELLEYDPVTGDIYNRKSKRKLISDEYGFIVVYDNSVKRKFKLKASTLAWELGNDKKLSESYRILHRNLDDADNRLCNLMILTRSVYRQVQEAIRNLDGALKLQAHPEDQHSYIITFQDKGSTKKLVVHDIIAAKQRFIRLQLKYAKLLNKYCIFD